MKRKLLSLFLVLAMLCSLFIPAMAAEEEAASLGDMSGMLVILHNNDVHGRTNDNAGYAGIAARAAEYRAAGADVLLFDAGDTLHGTPVANLSKGENIAKLLNMVGYAAMVPGNHDFNYGYERAIEIGETLDFPILAANVTYKDSGELVFEANTIIEIGAYKVGVFGLATVETVTKTDPKNVEPLNFAAGEEMYAIAQAQVDELVAAGADIIICLGHLGVDASSAPDRSTDVIEATTGIDLFIDGHSHTAFPEGEAHGETLLVSTGEYLKNIGEVVYDGETFTASLTASGDYADRDEAIAEAAKADKDAVEEEYGTLIVAQSEVALNGERAPGNRTEETNLGDLVADGMMFGAKKAGFNPVAAVVNGGGIRVSRPAGPISMLDIYQIIPFGNNLTVLSLPGTVLDKALEDNVAGLPAAMGGFPQTSGMTYTIALGEPAGDRVEIETIGGEAFDPEAVYDIVTLDFLGRGGDAYAEFKPYFGGVGFSVLDQAVTEYIAEELGGVITAEQYGEPQGRITIVPADIAAGTWFYDAAMYAFTDGIMKGTGAGWAPDATVTRATVFQTLYNMEGKPAVETAASFIDVEAGSWYADAAAWAEESGLTTGTGDGFAGDRAVTRAELAKIFADYMEYRNMYITAAASLTAFGDAADVAEWAEEGFKAVVGTAVMNGIDGNLKPADTATRASLAQMLYKFSKLGEITETTVSLIDKYGNATIGIIGQNLFAAGFGYGDILTVTIGEEVLDIPFCTAYSDVDNGSLVLRDAGAGRNLIIAINMGNFGETYGVAAGDAVSIALGEKEGYLAQYIARKLTRTYDRADYESDEIYANFREVTVGNIGAGKLYRSSSPVNNEISRAEYADKLIEAAGVATVINLANNAEELETYAADDSYATPYYDSLLAAEQVIYLGMGVDFSADDFKTKLAEGLKFMIENEGPYLVHCTEGKDRAGFVAALLEALMGATAEEIIEDYMLSYVNFYGVEVGSEQYDLIADGNIAASLRDIAGLEKGASLEGVNLVAAANNYLVNIGLSSTQIAALKAALS